MHSGLLEPSKIKFFLPKVTDFRLEVTVCHSYGGAGDDNSGEHQHFFVPGSSVKSSLIYFDPQNISSPVGHLLFT